MFTLIAILTTLTLPSFQKAVERARADIAIANLQAIWSAQRLYWLQYDHAYAESLQTLIDCNLLDKAMGNSTSGYEYQSILTTEGFRAVAERTGSSYWTGQFIIDQTGEISGSISGPGNIEINPGLQ